MSMCWRDDEMSKSRREQVSKMELYLPRYGSNNHLRSHHSSQDAQDVGPVVHTYTWEIGGSARVKSAKPYSCSVKYILRRMK